MYQDLWRCPTGDVLLSLPQIIVRNSFFFIMQHKSHISLNLCCVNQGKENSKLVLEPDAFLGINGRVTVSDRLLSCRIPLVFLHAASRHGATSMGMLPFIPPRSQDKAVSGDAVRKKSIFPERQSSPVLLGCCVWTGREGGCFPPSPPPH